jgi:hypothetical protein
MNLRVGLCGNPGGWEEVLIQEGIPFELLREIPDAADFPILILSECDDGDVAAGARRFLASNGSLLCTARVYSRVTGTTTRKGHVRYFIPDDTFPGNACIDFEDEAGIVESANALHSSRGYATAFVGTDGRGDLIVLPFDPADVERDDRSTIRTFWATHRRLPFERVSTMWRSGLRRIVARALELLHHRRDLPFVRLWYYPSSAESVFCFRVDTDGAFPSDVKRLLANTRKSEIPFTWFLDMESQKDHLGMYAECGADELALHCYAHQRYATYEQARGDIRKGLDVLKHHGMYPAGFASPFGVWNQDVARAIAESGFGYSSEFSYDYDGLPSHPNIGGRRAGILQIPSHPISIGSLRRQGFRSDDMLGYFRNVISATLERRNPIVLYHHPRDGYEEVLGEMFDDIRRRRIPSMTMNDFARWWRCREEVRCDCQMHGSSLRLQSPVFPSDVSLYITRADGTEAIVPFGPALELDSLPWRKRAPSGQLPRGFERIRRFNPWIHIIRLEDAIYKHLRPKIWGT